MIVCYAITTNIDFTSNDLCWRWKHRVLGYHFVQLPVAREPWTQNTQAMQQHPVLHDVQKNLIVLKYLNRMRLSTKSHKPYF